MYYLRSRYYKGEQSRFISSDLLLCGNLFTYCINHPIVKIDSNGNIDESILIGPGENLFALIQAQSSVLGDASDFLAEQQRIIKKSIPYLKQGMSDDKGYDCATYQALPLERTSGHGSDFIHFETSIPAILENKRGCLLFIARLHDYSLSQIPNGSILVREHGYLQTSPSGHAASLAAKVEGDMVKLNDAVGPRKGIKNVYMTRDELLENYQYIVWPKGLGTKEHVSHFVQPNRMVLCIK